MKQEVREDEKAGRGDWCLQPYGRVVQGIASYIYISENSNISQEIVPSIIYLLGKSEDLN